jgi:hypothetical protein
MLNIFKNKKPAAAPAVEAFTVRESHLCAELKVSKDELRLRRQYFLTQGRHWDYVNKRVLLSPVGAEILRGTAAFAVPEDFKENAPAADSGSRPALPAGLLLEKNPPPAVFTGKLVAWATPKRNERLLIAYLPGTDPENPLNLVTCLVRSNLNFLRGMELPGPGREVRQLRQDAYELLGACPRYRGRW